jgi:hypothetical protein
VWERQTGSVKDEQKLIARAWIGWYLAAHQKSVAGSALRVQVQENGTWKVRRVRGSEGQQQMDCRTNEICQQIGEH